MITTITCRCWCCKPFFAAVRSTGAAARHAGAGRHRPGGVLLETTTSAGMITLSRQRNYRIIPYGWREYNYHRENVTPTHETAAVNLGRGIV